MKLMKHITIALVLCAIPAFAFGQDVSCESCTHDVSVYMGEGGVVATADGAEKVTWVTTCSGVTRTGELTANDDGMVAALFSMDNGLACMATGKDMGSFQLGPVKDGGWFWITDDMNSAVGALVAKDIQMNDMVDITSAGAGVTMTAGTGAVYLKETATGRVGILPTIVAEPPTPPPTKCGYRALTATTYGRVMSSCMLGDGKTMVSATGPVDAYTGKRTPIMNNGMVTRPGATGASVTVEFRLLGNGSGHYTSDSGGNARLGHISAAPLSASFGGNFGSGGVSGNTDLTGSAQNGLTLATDTNVGTLTIEPDATYCPAKGTQHTAVVTINADASTVSEVVPDISENTAGTVAASFKLMVACPGASSPNMGSELVPDNPFPTE